VNIGMNLLLVPRYGIMAAAWATFAAFLLMLVMLTIIAQRVYPFPYEYRRLARIFATTTGVIGIGLSINLSLPADLLLKSALFAAFPCALAMSGFLSSSERAAVQAFVHGAATRLWRLRGVP
jgi:O-antigen/teichoic acid export membrane protein